MSTPITPHVFPSEPTTDSARAEIAEAAVVDRAEHGFAPGTFDESIHIDPETVADVRDEAFSIRADDGGSHYIGSSGFTNYESHDAREMADWDAVASHGGQWDPTGNAWGAEMGELYKQVDSAEAHDKGLSTVVYDEVAAQAVQAAPKLDLSPNIKHLHHDEPAYPEDDYADMDACDADDIEPPAHNHGG